MTDILARSEKDPAKTINMEHREKLNDRYGWVSPAVRKRSMRSGCFRRLTKYFKLYCKHSSLVGMKYVMGERVTWFDRILWFVVHAMIYSFVLQSIFNTYQDFIDTPIVTVPEDEYFSTTGIEFPGVAICTINRISLRSATKLATEIFRAKVSNYTVEEIRDIVLNLGDLYDSSFMQESNYTQINQLMSQLYGPRYDITDTMERLTPECSTILLRCLFHNVKRNCSDIFTLSKTQNGFCCTFNYVTENDDDAKFSNDSKAANLYKVDDISRQYGLTVVMNAFLEDYSYTFLPTIGWKVMIFSPYDYPDANIGISEILVSPLTEKNIEIIAGGLHSTQNIRSHKIEKRKCIFPNEERLNYTTYTYSDCLVDCKMKDIWNICKCRPFYYPRRGSTESRWLSIIPHNDKKLGDAIENISSMLNCEKCYPTCNDLSYYVTTSTSLLPTGYSDSELLAGINLTSHGIFHVYFTDLATFYLKQDISSQWYEQLSDVGGLCGFFTGFSLISIMECIYFTMLFISEILWPEVDFTPKEEDEMIHKISPIRTIYGNELLPRRGKNAQSEELQ